MPSLEESLAKQGVATKAPEAAAPAAPPPLSAPAPAQAPSPPAPAAESAELSRAAKAEVVLDFASDLSMEVIQAVTTSQGVEWSDTLENFSKLSAVERRRMSRFAPAAYPYVELVESKLEAYPKLGLALFGLALAMSFTGKLKKITSEIAAAKAANGEAPAPPIAAIPPPPGAPKAPAAPAQELRGVPPRKDNPIALAGLKI
jgi:pyruvate dehydrogenase E2 component (dihydrolipoamide acetyltransferase)